MLVASMAKQQKITTFLWYHGDAEAAIGFYISVFGNGRILERSYWGDGGPYPKGSLLTARFELFGQNFIALNGGPEFRFNEAISLMVECDTQKEIDHYWKALVSGGGEHSQCGWLKDRFGLSWQIAPRALLRYIESDDDALRTRVMAAMMQMTKIDLAAIEKAAAEGAPVKKAAKKPAAKAKRAPTVRRR